MLIFMQCFVFHCLTICFFILFNAIFPFECTLWLNFQETEKKKRESERHWARVCWIGWTPRHFIQLHDYDKRNSFQLQIDSESFGCSEHHNRHFWDHFHFHGAWVSNWIHHTIYTNGREKKAQYRLWYRSIIYHSDAEFESEKKIHSFFSNQFLIYTVQDNVTNFKFS